VDPALLPIYVVVPRGIRSFLDLHRAVIEAISEEDLAGAGEQVFAASGGTARSNVEAALLRIAMQSSTQSELALAWLRAESVPLKDLRTIGIGKRLESAADGVDVLDGLINCLTGGSRRLIFLLDEVQEFSELGAKRHAECVGGLHKLFDRHTSGLTLVLSFTTASQGSVRSIIGDPLFDRASERISLPLLSRDEAAAFILGLIEEWSIDRERAPFPFTDDAVSEGVAMVERAAAPLSPRTLIKAFDHVLRSAELDIDEGALNVCDAAYVNEHARVEDDMP
jgi:hypothetical protein